MKKTLTALSLNKPRTVIWLTAVLTVAFAAVIPRIDIDTDPENMLREEQRDRVFHNLVKKRFTLHDAIVVGAVNETHPDGIYNQRSLQALHELSEGILAIDGVVTADVMSLSVADNITQGGPGEIRFEWMMKDPPTNDAEVQRIRESVARLPLLTNTLVSEDSRAAAIYVPIESKDLSFPISLEIQALAASLSSTDEYHITGLPVAEDTFGVEMFRQMAISAPLAGLMIFVLMWYFFRSVRLVIAPMIVAVATVVITMGLLIGLGFTVHIMSSMIPIFLMPIAVVDSVHIMSEFADHYSPGDDPGRKVEKVIGHLYKPMLFTSLTTAVGFLSLLLTPVPPVQIFGVFVAFGVLLAFLVTIVFIPAYVVRMSPASLAVLGRLQSGSEAGSPLAKGIRALGRFANRRSRWILAATVVVLALSTAGILRIQINDNPVRWFKSDHRIRVADVVLNEHFAGTYDAFLVLDFDAGPAIESFRAAASARLADAPGGELAPIAALIDAAADDPGRYFGQLIAAADDALFDGTGDPEVLEDIMRLAERAQASTQYFRGPEILRYIAGLQSAMLDSGYVGKSNALPDVVKVVNRELLSGKSADYRIPDSADGVGQTLLQYQSSHRPQDLWHMVTPDYTSTAIWLQLTSGDNQDMSRVIDFVDDYFGANPLPAGVTANWAGKTYLNVIWQNEMVAGMLKSLLGAFVVVFVMMTLLFRSPVFGALAMVPLSVTVLAVYGLIGWIGKDYDMPIAVLSSLTLGLSVDFAIHFLQRMRALVAESGSFATGARQIFDEPARAIARNAIVIALGFTPLFFAALVPYITVGAFMASIMVFSGLATLVLLPAILSTGRRFVFGGAALADDRRAAEGQTAGA